jgi:hypothetical protein
MNDMNLYKEIFTVACDLYERSGRVKGRDLDNWLEAERIVRTLRKIGGGGEGNNNILINVPATGYSVEWKNSKRLMGNYVERTQVNLLPWL